MQRTSLLRTLSVAALSAGLSHAALAATATSITGGGATAQSFLIQAELNLYNSQQAKYAYGTFWPVSSGTAQTAFVTDNSLLLTSTVAAFPVDYVVSEYALSSTNYALWQASTNTVGQSAAGNLIQAPLVGTAVPIVIVNSAITKNGALELTDAQLCGIFSGKYTDWSQISVPTGGTTPAAGAITVVYRSDTGGTTFNLTNHFVQACTTGPTGNSNFAPGFVATNTFTKLFTGGVLPNTNFVGVVGNLAQANYLSSIGTAAPVTSAIGYVSPDYTSLAPAPSSVLGNGQRSELLTAALQNTTNGKYYTATAANIALALANPGATATNTSPPTNAIAAAVPTNWVPSLPQPAVGYPISAYSNIFVPQCFKTAAVGAGLVKFLDLHYANAAYGKIQTNNGLVRIANSAANKFQAAVNKNLLANANGWNVNVGNATACKGFAGR